MRIDLAWMIRKGFAVPGSSRTGNLRWTRGGQPSGNISYTCWMFEPDDARLELRFSIPDRMTDERKHCTQNIRLSYTVPRYGGKRWWMHCPVNGARVGKLYVPPGGDIFASRRAWRIGYRSQRGTRQDRTFEKLFRIQRRLNSEEGWGAIPMRPKGMHHRTYERHLERYFAIDEQCGRETLALLGRIGADLPFEI
ncbi:MAG: hypothetical protein V2J51_03435 [Erythrobacter sp.]|nr:hypothetical protein [Erythrobacter sp.]